jgi:hypothetical protein
LTSAKAPTPHDNPMPFDAFLALARFFVRELSSVAIAKRADGITQRGEPKLWVLAQMSNHGYSVQRHGDSPLLIAVHGCRVSGLGIDGRLSLALSIGESMFLITSSFRGSLMVRPPSRAHASIIAAALPNRLRPTFDGRIALMLPASDVAARRLRVAEIEPDYRT